MNRIVRNMFPLLAAVLFVCLSVPVFAQASPSDINVHVSNYVAVPGHLLAPGDYIFRRVSEATPNTFEILSSEGQKFVGVFQVLPVLRNSGMNTEIDLTPADQAGLRMIQAWYGPGDSNGYQFVYSNADIRRLDQLAQSQSGTPAGQP